MEEFNVGTLYRNLKPRLRVLEDQRKIVFKKVETLKKASLLIGITISVVAFTQGIWWVSIFVFAGGLIVYGLLYKKYLKSYRKNYKSKIFTECIDELGYRYTYDLEGALDEQEFKMSGLFQPFTSIQSEDLITGKFDTYSFQMIEASLMWNKKSTDAKKSSSTSMVYKGLFFAGTISLTFPTKIWILSKKVLGFHARNRISSQWDKVTLDHATFSKEHEVYSENGAMASQVLQTAILDTILETKQTLAEERITMELSFQNNRVFISISSGKDQFEPPLSVPVTDFETFKANFNYLAGTTGLLKKLTLVKT